jgi:hypothetical protein
MAVWDTPRRARKFKERGNFGPSDGISRGRREIGAAVDRVQTSNGPDVHVILVARKHANDDANFMNSNEQDGRGGN